MKLKKANHFSFLIYGGFCLLLFLVFSTGCSNDNSVSSGSKSMEIDISEVKEQIGYSGQSSSSEEEVSVSVDDVEENDATSAVKALIIGAIVISKSTPYSLDDALTEDDLEDLAEDVINSQSYITYVNLPTSSSTVEVKVPPPSAGNWQIIVVGVNFTLDSLDDIIDNESDITYYGFIERFYEYDDVGSSSLGNITMQRACLADPDDPPKGCAIYQPDLDDDPVVSSAVEIIRIEQNGSAVWTGGAGSHIVRNATNENDAVSLLEGYRNSFSVGDIITVVTTHQESASESSSCEGSAAVNLETNCNTQEYKIVVTNEYTP